MREVLFRGKSVETGEWKYGYYIPDGERAYIGQSFGLQFCEVYPSTVGQYTGLTDCNGKPIFEGDILHGVFYGFPAPCDFTFSVGWSENEAGFQGNWFEPGQCEVIGNIHDNPDLVAKD